ncbi:plasmid pRiA4b ORF-3 family protein [Bacillus sp. B-jedd]|uniref:plasmid pRiA4b ORF-3 family protein n=1 Tax=Bacillus sp. B-jedd TaxID=1476857 RepID=UPI0006622222|nr:plasmid pRiA4b ORF-3 family protein [Bacillus sp. B-jedd]
MKIQCTKKLLEKLDVELAPVEMEEDSLFSWHANLITVNRRNAVVVVNDKNRYAVILHGLKAKDFKKLGELAVLGIREAFRDAGIKEEVIEAYFSAAGERAFGKTKDRKLVARLNKACENVGYIEERYPLEGMFPADLTRWVNGLLAGDGKSYIYPDQEMYQDLEEFSGGPVFGTRAVQLKMTLALEEYRLWRRVIVPLNRTFPDLHEIIQAAFGWKDYHLHEFNLYDGPAPKDVSLRFREKAKPFLNLVCSEEAFAYPVGDVEMKMETGIRLSDYLPASESLAYRYDFGDDWLHIIEVEEVIDEYDKPQPICVDGEGNTPPEDVGGEGGYAEFLRIVADRDDPEHEHLLEWGRMQGYKPFEIDGVNRRLKRL